MFRIKVVFQVHHEVLSGLKYLQVVRRKGIRVSKDEEMLVSFFPFFFSFKFLGWSLFPGLVLLIVSVIVKGSYAPNTTDKPYYEKKCEFPFFFHFLYRREKKW